MISRRTFVGLGLAAGAVVLAGGSIATAYSRTIGEARARVSRGSETIETSFGRMEYAAAGEGQPVLMIHGSGGGFDQGLSFSERLSSGGFEIIAPSRFGYLGSDFHPDPSSANQADAFVELLDALEIDRLPVIGGSAGALSAIEFAIRHPERCSALVAIVPATHAPDRPSAEPMSPMQERVMRAMLDSDILFWSAMQIMRDQMIGTMLATDPALVNAASPEEQNRVERILREILPVSVRSRGLMNDAMLTLDPPPQALDQITVPTLAISLEDDRFGTFDAARHIASQVPGAMLVSYPSGGHVWVGHDAQLFADIAAFLRDVS